MDRLRLWFVGEEAVDAVRQAAHRPFAWRIEQVAVVWPEGRAPGRHCWRFYGAKQ